MTKCKLELFDAFNTMRVFLDMRYEKTHSDKLGTLCGALNLWKNSTDWKENPQTFDPRAWQDWLNAVEKTLQELGRKEDPKNFIYDEETAFLCMKNYIQNFYDQTPWKDIKNILEEIQNTKYSENDSTWQEWLEAINHVLYDTYELDVYA